MSPSRSKREIHHAVAWIARQIVGNDVKGFDPFPTAIRGELARAMVADDFLGWPDVETALFTLDEWEWEAEAVATENETCGRLLVGMGDDTYDPLCVLPEGHASPCKPEEAAA